MGNSNSAEWEKRIVKDDVSLPANQQKLAFTLKSVFTEEECKAFIATTEKKGYQPALVNIGGGRQQLMTDVRNNDRCIIDDPKVAAVIYERIRKYVPQTWRGCKAVGLNERLRFLRYDPGQKFDVHMDGEYHRDNGERSYVTVQLYLNQGFEGGATTFIDVANYQNDSSRKDVDCVPLTGMVLIFQHDIFHCGSEVTKGRKYALRTDVMYAPAKSSYDAETRQLERELEKQAREKKANKSKTGQDIKWDGKAKDTDSNTAQPEDAPAMQLPSAAAAGPADAPQPDPAAAAAGGVAAAPAFASNNAMM